jgi:hypothetical protein
MRRTTTARRNATSVTFGKKSNGKALFLMTVIEKGKAGLLEQITEKIG